MIATTIERGKSRNITAGRLNTTGETRCIVSQKCRIGQLRAARLITHAGFPNGTSDHLCWSSL